MNYIAMKSLNSWIIKSLLVAWKKISARTGPNFLRKDRKDADMWFLDVLRELPRPWDASLKTKHIDR